MSSNSQQENEYANFQLHFAQQTKFKHNTIMGKEVNCILSRLQSNLVFILDYDCEAGITAECNEHIFSMDVKWTALTAAGQAGKDERWPFIHTSC